MKITYYTDRRIEILSIKTDGGKPIKERRIALAIALLTFYTGMPS